MTNPEFRLANQEFDGKLKSLKKAGKDTSTHKPPIDPDDMAKFYVTGVLGNTNPVSLQCKIFLEMSLHFGRLGRERWQSMTRDSFTLKKDAMG